MYEIPPVSYPVQDFRSRDDREGSAEHMVLYVHPRVVWVLIPSQVDNATM
jgi:hypothetical protein